MNLKEAKAITGGLSQPNKMPGYAYNLPAQGCITGAKLVKISGSVCSGCYALKGRYRFPNVKEALNRRLNSLNDPEWIPAMVVLVAHYSLKVPDALKVSGVVPSKKFFPFDQYSHGLDPLRILKRFQAPA